MSSPFIQIFSSSCMKESAPLSGGLGRIEILPRRPRQPPPLAFYDQIGGRGPGRDGSTAPGARPRTWRDVPAFQPQGGLRQDGLFEEHGRAREGNSGRRVVYELGAGGGAELGFRRSSLRPSGNERDD